MLEPESDIEVVGEATNGREAVSLVGRLEPEVVLMDLQMPELDGVAATKQIRDRYPETNVLVLTTFDTDADITRAISAGATGYLLKDAPRQDLFQAIRAAARGESVLTPAVASRLMSKMRGPGVQSLEQGHCWQALYQRGHRQNPPRSHLRQAWRGRPHRRRYRRPGTGDHPTVRLTLYFPALNRRTCLRTH
jgi:DNA-binding NarL/FixJ family response regulator